MKDQASMGILIRFNDDSW